MFRRLFQQALWVGLGFALLVVPARAAAVGEHAITPALTLSSNAPSPYPSPPLGAGERGGAGREEGNSRPEYRITHWTAENGLPQNSIKALAQTRDGYLWIGTLKGLARFDGVRFKVFDHGSVPAMKHDSINDLAADATDGGLWIGTGEGLLNYRDHRFERCGAEQGVSEAVGTLCPAREGGVWFSPRWGHLGLARAGAVQLQEFGPARSTNLVRQLGQVTPGRVLALLGTVHCLRQIELNGNSVVPVNAPGVECHCSSFFQDSDGSLWLCRDDGIWHGSGGTWTRATTADENTGPWPSRMYRTSDGQVWVTQTERDRSSLQRLVDGRLESFEAAEFPTALNITRLLEDHEGNLWVGTTTGLFRLEPKRLRVYSRRDGLRNDNAQAVAEGTDGTIWVGTSEGISSIREGKVVNLPSPEANVDWNKIAVFLADRQNALWAGIKGQWLARFQQGSWQLVRGPAEIGDAGYIKAIQEDREGRMWIGTGVGVLCRENDRWSYISAMNGLSNADVRVIHQDRRGDLWLGTYGGGLNRLHDGQITAYKTGRGEQNNRAWWIHEDAEGVFWVGSEDGLNRFVPPGLAEARSQKSEVRSQSASVATTNNEGRFFTFTTEQGLGENVVNNIQEDEFGCLWLSGLRGVYRVPRQQLNEVAARQRATVECIAYGEADGMLNSECNGGDNQPAGCKDDRGRIWFPTAQGVVMIDPKAMQRTESPPPVVIEQVRANGEVVFGDGVGSQRAEDRGQKSEGRSPKADGLALNYQPSTHNYRLAPGQGRVLEIHYSANSMAAAERVAFKYRLEGHDRDWLWDDQNRRVAFYTNLRPGNYTFRVTARGPHGTWNVRGDQLSFYVAPHFYETWSFYGLCAALVVGTAAGVQAYRLRWQHRALRAQQVTALAEERARIARDLHDDLGASLTGLALQLEAAQHRGRAEAGQLENLAVETRSLAHELRELAWTTNPRCDNTGSVVAFIGDLTERFCQAAGLECRLDLPAGGSTVEVPARVRHELVAVVKESLANVAKHAGARGVTVGLTLNDGELNLTVKDDGRGFDPARTGAGSGLRNLRERMQQVGGSLEVTTKPGAGTTVTTVIPLREA